MKINDILTEQEIAEMNRRDFLKGVGAGAVGTAAIGYGLDSPQPKEAKISVQYAYLLGYLSLIGSGMDSEFEQYGLSDIPKIGKDVRSRVSALHWQLKELEVTSEKKAELYGKALVEGINDGDDVLKRIRVKYGITGAETMKAQAELVRTTYKKLQNLQ